ncbi:MAG: transketolase [Chloroflexaceae bacterium]|nr:transketolase [Chloroflexaceae bacterium]
MATQIDRQFMLAQQLRVDSVRAAAAAGSGHPTSSLSAADLMAVLLHNHLRYNFDEPDNPGNDHLIFSKGHASPLLYAMYKAAGAITDPDLMSFRKAGSAYEGHPTPTIPWVDVATGSLGQGLPIGVGIALAGKYLDKVPYRVWVLCGDSEMAEGSMWEAFDKASYYKLDNLIAILDMNRLGQRGPTAAGWDSDLYAARASAFGWRVITVDGHAVDAIDRAYTAATQQSQDRPVFIVARTIKGRGVSFMEDKEGWHGKPTEPDDTRKAIAELGGERMLSVEVHRADVFQRAERKQQAQTRLPEYAVGDQVATRQVYGEALKAVGDANGMVVALDAEVSNSTKADEFKKAHEDRFFEMFIAEQQMIASAVGMSVRGYIPFSSTFASFLTRAYDFIRMAAISSADIRLAGSHAGVSIGEDGPSQMGLEDLAMMRAVYGSTVLYPCDANQTVQLVANMAEQSGISYIRTTRGKTPVIYPAGETFPIGGSKTLLSSDEDSVTIVTAGITVHEALRAAETLQQNGTRVRVIDAYSVKPIDAQSLAEAVRATGGRLVIVEDHWPEGGLGDAVLQGLIPRGNLPPLQVRHLAVRHMPGSATPHEQLEAAGISANHIVQAVHSLF